MNRLTCCYWIWAKENPDAGAQCGGKVAVTVGQTLGYCQPHAAGMLRLPIEVQRNLMVKHL